MEIKIVCFEDEKNGGVSATHLFEGDRISHNKVHVTALNVKDWLKNSNGHFIGIPGVYLIQKEEDALPDLSTLFISLYDKKGDYDFILVKDAVIYITSDGHTIDRIGVE